MRERSFSSDYIPVFTYTGRDVFETEYAEPPDGFVATRLADIAEIHRGIRSRGSASEINSSPESAICYFITPSNLQTDGVLLPDSKSVIARTDLEDQFTLKPSDILLTMFTTGAQNKVAMVPKNIPEPMTFNDSLIRIRVDLQRADPRAVFAFLQSDTGQRILRLMASGMVVARLTVRDIAAMQVFLPKIVGITDETTKLGAAMRAIHEIKEHILPLLEQAEQDHEQSTANPEEAPNLRAAAERLRDLASTLVPPSLAELVDLLPLLDSARHIQDDFRNHLSHTSTAHEGIAERTLRTFKPLVEQLLEQFEFLTRYPLVRISSFVVRQVCWMRRMVVYKGVIPRSEEETLTLLPIYPSAESDHLVLLGGEDKVLDMYPLYQLLTNVEALRQTALSAGA